MEMLNSINQLLEHIKNVEEEAIALSKESIMKFSNFLERNSIEIDDDVAEALQYQDIISQQLSATIEVIENVQQSIEKFNHAHKEDEAIAVGSIDMLQSKLSHALERAKDKRQAFSGNVAHKSDDEAIEFF